jgi:hypothetical protein
VACSCTNGLPSVVDISALPYPVWFVRSLRGGPFTIEVVGSIGRVTTGTLHLRWVGDSARALLEVLIADVERNDLDLPGAVVAAQRL